MTRLSLITFLFSVFSLSVSAAEDSDEKKARFEAISEPDTMVMVPMRDGVKLATDVYLPKGDGPFPTIFLKTPYDYNEINGSSLDVALEALQRQYAFVIQNERGRYYSEGEWELLGHPRTDGYDALSWLAAQEWSNGKVATLGCSSSAEWQLALATQNHPAHTAMVPMAAGAGIGRVGEFQEQGNFYKGGVHQTLMSAWLYRVQQNIRPQFPPELSQEQLRRLRQAYSLAADMPEQDWAKQLRKLPAVDWLEDAGGNEGPARALLMRKPADPAWFEGGLYHDDEDFAVPALWLNSWFDVSQGPNLALFNHVRANAADRAVREGQYMMIAPTLHCAFFRTPRYEDLVVGDLNVGYAWRDYWSDIFAFLDHYMKKKDREFSRGTDRVRFFTLGSNEWQGSDSWPPEDVQTRTLYLAGDGPANSLFGAGRLTSAPADEGRDSFLYDPMNPVPSLGGGVCCNGDATVGGSFDQRGIEARADVLVYTSEPLDSDWEVTGFVRPVLFVSSDAKDTDFTVKLVDVHPDGSAWNVDDTILRARYREGWDREVMMQEGSVYELRPTPMSTSYRFKAGHRLRVEVSSSKFPQYMRNLNTGGNNTDETEGVVARNSVHRSAAHPSRIELPVRP